MDNLYLTTLPPLSFTTVAIIAQYSESTHTSHVMWYDNSFYYCYCFFAEVLWAFQPLFPLFKLSIKSNVIHSLVIFCILHITAILVILSYATHMTSATYLSGYPSILAFLLLSQGLRFYFILYSNINPQYPYTYLPLFYEPFFIVLNLVLPYSDSLSSFRFRRDNYSMSLLPPSNRE